MKIRFNDNHEWMLGDKLIRQMVREHREKLGLTKGRYAKAHGIERSAHYAFEKGEHRGYRLVEKELNAMGYEIHGISGRVTKV